MAFWSNLFKTSGRAEFERQVLPHLDSLYAVAMRLLRNERDAEDLVQDTVLRAFRFFHRFQPDTNCRAWLLKILHNVFITQYRQRVRERELLEAASADEGAPPATGSAPIDPETELAAGLLSDDVRRALARLPEEFRTAVVLCDLEGLSYREIADVMDCPVGTVMSRLHRGRRLLQESLRGYAAEAGITRERDADVIPLRRGDA
jgi:RNA polymerase sigma-70 factor (ECF subfamily)